MQNEITELRNQVRTMGKLVPIVIGLCVFCLGATDRKSHRAVDIEQLTSDCQVMPNYGSTDEMNFVWWIPEVFWKISMAQDDSLTYAEKKETLDVIEGVSILCIAQGELSDFGSFLPYSKAIVQRGMTILFTNKEGKVKRLKPIESIKPDLRFMLKDINAMLSNLLGQMGEGMQLFVLDNRDTATSAKMDPYKDGLLTVNLTGNGGTKVQANIQFPFNSLYVPRICPNGKEAHISWNFCPWTGKQLGVRLLQE